MTVTYPIGEDVLTNLWKFLQDENNRALLAWVGSGIVIVLSGGWAVFRFFTSKKKQRHSPSTITKATRGGVAAGRDIRDSRIDIRGDSSKG